LAAALRLHRESGVRGNEAWALNHYAAVFADAGDPVRALAVYRDALGMSREVGQQDDEALALEGIGRCLLLNRDAEDREDAQDAADAEDAQDGTAYLNRAFDIFRRLGMRADEERVRARLAGRRRAAGPPPS
jgi:tetratricopeptide (TPR) repeat protein